MIWCISKQLAISHRVNRPILARKGLIGAKAYFDMCSCYITTDGNNNHEDTKSYTNHNLMLNRTLTQSQYQRPDYNDVKMGAVVSKITSLTIVYSTVYSGADQRKHQSSASLAFVRGIHRWPVNSPHKWPVTRKMFTFDDVIMIFLTGFIKFLCCLHQDVYFGVN